MESPRYNWVLRSTPSWEAEATSFFQGMLGLNLLGSELLCLQWWGGGLQAASLDCSKFWRQNSKQKETGARAELALWQRGRVRERASGLRMLWKRRQCNLLQGKTKIKGDLFLNRQDLFLPDIARSFMYERAGGRQRRVIPSIATKMAVWPFISWSVIVSLTSLEMAKPLRLIHSRFPISTEKVWGATSVQKSWWLFPE